MANKIKTNKHKEIFILNDYIILDGAFIIHKDYCEFDNKIFDKLVKKETQAQTKEGEIIPLINSPKNWKNMLQPSHYNENISIKSTNIIFEDYKMKHRYFIVENTDNKVILATMQDLYYSYLPDLCLRYSPDQKLFTIWDMKKEFNKIVGIIAPTRTKGDFITDYIIELNAHREYKEKQSA